MGGVGGGDAGLQGGAGLFACPYGLEPVGQVEQFAIGLVIEVGTPAAGAQDHFLGLDRLVGVGDQFHAAPVAVNAAFGAHEGDHRPVPGVAEGALKVGGHAAGVGEQGLHTVGRFPHALGVDETAHRGGAHRGLQIEQGMGHINPVHHQVGEDATAKVPEPAPVHHLVGIVGLPGCAADKRGPVHRLEGDGGQVFFEAGRVAVPGQVDLVDLADGARTDQLTRLLDVGHAALLHAHLADAFRGRLRRAQSLRLGGVVGEGLFHINMLAGLAGGDGHGGMPVVG